MIEIPDPSKEISARFCLNVSPSVSLPFGQKLEVTGSNSFKRLLSNVFLASQSGAISGSFPLLCIHHPTEQFLTDQ